MMKRETLMQKLSDKGVHVVGTTEDFYGYENGDGIWISAESTPQLFDYWSSKWANQLLWWCFGPKYIEQSFR
jgi:hypothetical protein